jgi:hypothetical protein
VITVTLVEREQKDDGTSNATRMSRSAPHVGAPLRRNKSTGETESRLTWEAASQKDLQSEERQDEELGDASYRHQLEQ